MVAIGGTTSAGTAWRLPVRDAAGGVARGLWTLHVQDGGTRVPVVVSDGKLLATRSPGADLLPDLPASPRGIWTRSAPR